jgi:hypothetical protein
LKEKPIKMIKKNKKIVYRPEAHDASLVLPKL